MTNSLESRLNNLKVLDTVALKGYAIDCQLSKYNKNEITESAFRRFCIERASRQYITSLKRQLGYIKQGKSLIGITIKGSNNIEGSFGYKVEIVCTELCNQVVIKNNISGTDFKNVFLKTNILYYLQGKYLALCKGTEDLTNYGYTTIKDLIYLCEKVGLKLIECNYKDDLGIVLDKLVFKLK